MNVSPILVIAMRDNLTRAIVGIGTALALLIVVGLLAFSGFGFGETVPLARLPWVQPVAQSFMLLSAFAIALLCLGRYRALGGAWVFWAGVAFLENGIMGVFYLLSWPGLLGDHGVIAQLSNTASWLAMLTFSFIALLLAAIIAREPETLSGSRYLVAYALAGILFTLIGALSVHFEGWLPGMIVGTTFSPLSLGWDGILVVLAAIAAALAYRRNYRHRDAMFGYLALFLVIMAFALLVSIIGGKRYDFWWYSGRILFIPAYLVVLFGFLQEGYLLFGVERTRAEERARLADQLEFERARWQATVDNMLDLVAICDATGRVVYLNPAYTTLIGRFVEPGLPVEEHPKYYQIFHPDGTMFAAEDLPLQRAALRDEEVHEVEVAHRTTVGREVFCVFNAAPLRDESGRVVGAVAVGRDVTLQRRVEAEREQLLNQVGQLADEAQRRATELDTANKELEAFSYSVSHDLRAPLRHIDGFSKILLQDFADKLNERGKQYLQFLREGSQRMEQLIDAMLKLSQVTRAEMRRQPVNLSDIAESILAELLREQPARPLEFTVAPDVIAEGDPALLRIVLENLLGNAWKFTSKLPVARIEFGVTQQDGEAVYYVRDNGAGFDMAHADRLFSAFQRLHKAEEFPGTGIGLATVQRIIHRHGGRVWAVGEVGKGATIYITLG